MSADPETPSESTSNAPQPVDPSSIRMPTFAQLRRIGEGAEVVHLGKGRVTARPKRASRAFFEDFGGDDRFDVDWSDDLEREFRETYPDLYRRYRSPEELRLLEQGVPWDAAYDQVAALGRKQADCLDDARANVDNDRTEAQVEAGNARCGHCRLHGLRITLQFNEGEVRKPGFSPLPGDYGHIKGFQSHDGMNVDVLLGPALETELAFLADFKKPDGEFDETKVFLGYASRAEARAAFDAGWPARCRGRLTAVTIPQLKVYLEHGDVHVPATQSVARLKAAADDPEPPDGALVIVRETTTQILRPAGPGERPKARKGERPRTGPSKENPCPLCGEGPCLGAGEAPTGPDAPLMLEIVAKPAED